MSLYCAQLPESHTLTSLDHERIVALSPVPVSGHDAPEYPIGTRRQQGHSYLQESWVRWIHPSISLVYFFIFPIANDNRREDWFQIAVEPDSHLVRSNAQCCSHSRFGMVREGMARGYFRKDGKISYDEKSDKGPDKYGLPDASQGNTGLPMLLGNKSSRNR